MQVYVDTVGSPERYQEFLSTTFNDRIKFTVTKKADSLFPVVSAASIAAKVTRDTGMESWVFTEPGFTSSGPLGSGYPGGTHVLLYAEVIKVLNPPTQSVCVRERTGAAARDHSS